MMTAKQASGSKHRPRGKRICEIAEKFGVAPQVVQAVLKTMPDIYFELGPTGYRVFPAKAAARIGRAIVRRKKEMVGSTVTKVAIELNESFYAVARVLRTHPDIKPLPRRAYRPRRFNDATIAEIRQALETDQIL